MITPDTLKVLTTLKNHDLTRALFNNGYTGCTFKDVRFLGITNSGAFCYSVTYYDETGTGELEDSKVFVTYTGSIDSLLAEF